MRFATFKGEQTLAQLTGRLLRKKDGEAEAALLAANPGLSNLKTLSPGTILTIPYNIDLNPAEESRPVPEAVAPLLASGNKAIDAMQQAVAATLDAHAQKADETLKLLRSADLDLAFSRNPDLKKQLVPQITEAAKARIKEAKAQKTAHDTVFSQMKAALADLTKLAG